jgi:hypothetical protein
MFWNVVFKLEPNAVAPRMMATPMSEAMRPYSIASLRIHLAENGGGQTSWPWDCCFSSCFLHSTMPAGEIRLARS